MRFVSGGLIVRPGPPPPDHDRDAHAPWHSKEDDNPFRLREFSDGSSSEFRTIDWLVCILCPGFGCMMGIIRLLLGEHNGARMLGFSLLFALLWNMLRMLIVAAHPRL
jgi:hypothetical protein